MTDVDRLLALANGAALHKALVKEVPTAKYRTVARWCGPKRKQPPAEMIEPILRAFGVDTAKEADPFDWAGLMEKVDSIAVAVDARVGETPEQRVARLAVEGAATPPGRSSGGGSKGRARQAPAPTRPSVRRGQ